MEIPSWFKKELRIVDPTYWVKMDKEKGLYQIVKDVDIWIELPHHHKRARVRGPRIVTISRDLNQALIDDLKHRKELGRKLNIVENPMNELRYLKEQEDAAKKKEEELMLDMITEGIMKADRFANTMTVDYGGKNGY